MEPFFVITVASTGAYVARFSVAFTENGTKQTANSGNFTSGTQKAVNIPSDATDIFLKVEGEVFIDDWNTIFTEQWASAPDAPICFKIWGITTDMHHEQVACPS
jgi:hypothetical protein